MELPHGEKKFENMFNRFDKIPACDRRSDGQTSCHGIVHAYAEYRAVTIERAENTCNRTTASEIVLFYLLRRIDPNMWAKRCYLFKPIRKVDYLSDVIGQLVY